MTIADRLAEANPLNNSLVIQPDANVSNPMMLEHVRVLQALKSIEIVLDNALKNYYTRNAAKNPPVELLWVLHPAVVSALSIAQSVSHE